MAGKQGPGTVSTKQARIAQLARQMPETALYSLSHHMDLDWFRAAHKLTRKDGAVGIDGQRADEYAQDLDENLRSLLERAKSGTYRAPPVRRVHIPKGNGGKTRPIGIPTYEDKVLQRAVLMLLEPVYEQDFYDCSYGFRPRMSAHDAVEALDKGVHRMSGGWVLEVDIQSFFDALDHEKLRDLLRKRVVDGVVVRLIGKWLRAGVLEGGVLRYSDHGTPQGGVISPMLANIYLHEVLDKWWSEEVQPRLRGRSFLVRFADDFVLVFSDRKDALRVQKVLPKRFARFGLTLHPEKTRLIRFRRPRSDGGGPKSGSFDFLGFTFYWGRSRRKKWVLKQKTAKDRFSRAVKAVGRWLRGARHMPVGEQAKVLGQKLRGHYNYYGILGNVQAISRFFYEVLHRWKKWLSRRSQRARLTWEAFTLLVSRHPLPLPRLQLKRKQLRLANL